MSHAAFSTDDPLIGATIAGRYQIAARVGSGAMGAVYRAVQSGLGRQVALKVLKRDLAWGGDTVQRFRREAHAMSALNHPNTVRVFDFGATDEGLLYLAMELLEGELVTERLMQQGVLSVTEAVRYAQQVLRSIGEAHAKGIVHRDLKPDNIFLAHVRGESAPMVKVLDFGIAKAVEGERKIDQFETLDGTVFGTPRYMAPEQAAGKALDPRTDLYAVGIMLYEFLSGQPPFVDSDAVVVMAKHIREAPVPLCKAAPARPIPKSLEAAVGKALAKDPKDRFQSAEEFDQALTDCLPDIERSELNGGRTSLLDVVTRVSVAIGVPQRRGRGVGVAVLGSLIVLLMAAAYWVLGRHTSNATSPVVMVQVPSASPQAGAPGIGEVPATRVADAPTAATAAGSAGAAALAPAVVTLKTEPDGADVWRDGTQLGVTPLDIVMPAGKTASVSLHKAGYVDHTVELASTPTTRVVSLTALSPAAGLRVTRATPTTRTTRATHATPSRHASKRASTTSPSDTTPHTPASPYEKF